MDRALLTVMLTLMLIGFLFIAAGLALHSKAFLWLGDVLLSIPLIVLLLIIVGFAVLFIVLIALAILVAIAIASGGAVLLAAILLVIAIPILVLALIGKATRKRVFVKRQG